MKVRRKKVAKKIDPKRLERLRKQWAEAERIEREMIESGEVEVSYRINGHSVRVDADDNDW